MSHVTIFKDIFDTSNPKYIDIHSALDRIKNGESKEAVEKIRTLTDKELRNEAKKYLPCVCYGGKFSSRNDKSVDEFSGIMAIDFDGFESPEDLEQKKFELQMDDYTFALFVSPSGNGLKCLVKIPDDIENFKGYFSAIMDYYNTDKFDKSCSNVSRVCYESYDPDLFINEDSKTWDTIKQAPKVEARKVILPITEQSKVIGSLKKWWQKNYGLVSGSRNQNIFILAAALNEYGVSIDDAKASLSEYEQADFPMSEITLAIDSAYKAVEAFGRKKFEDFEALDKAKEMVSKNVPKEEIKKVLPAITEEAIEDLKEDTYDFWMKTHKGEVKITVHKYRDFLHAHGFTKYYASGNKDFLLIKVVNNIMSDTSDNQIRDFVFEHLDKIEDKSIYDFYAEKIKYGKEDFLAFLPTVDPIVLRDSENECRLYYKDKYIVVSPDRVDAFMYKDMSGYIWENQKIDRTFSVADHRDCEYERFIYNISGRSDKRKKSIESTIGFLLHSFKPSSFCPAVILNDETISDNPEGGTGKGIFVRAISHMKKNVTIDGKVFAFNKSFPYQRVSADTQVLTFDDVQKNFDFERLFSLVTEGITVEKKNKQEIFIPFDESPKILITTNYAIKGTGNSFERRKWELEFAQYYSKSFTPRDEFGHDLFSSWDEDEWLRYDNYMVHCIQVYLKEGLVESPFKNLEIRKLEAATSSEFREWVLGDDKDFIFVADKDYLAQDIFNDFTSNYPDYAQTGKMRISNRTFYRWLNEYALYRFGSSYIDSKGMNGKVIRFQESKKEIQTKLDV